jgi:RES domain-containing protein
MITSWRVVKTKFSADAFSGEGPRLFGGRWNSPGVRMVYTSGSVALATLELLVHLNSIGPLPGFSICSVEFDDSLVESIDRSRLPSDWYQSPPPTNVQAIGDEWISRASSVVLEVPSAVISLENNYLVNPGHKDFNRLRLGRMKPFNLDGRLIS